MLTTEILDRLQSATGKAHKKTGATKWQCVCPAHADKEASLTVDEVQHGKTLLHCHAGCQPQEIVDAVGIRMSDLFADSGRTNGSKGKAKQVAMPTIVATYDYVDEQGKMLYQAVRLSPKSFRQRRPDGHEGWTWKLGDTRRVLYHLPEVLEAAKMGKRIYVCEGEKDADALRALGLRATTNAMGAGKWREEYTISLKGAQVIVLPDADKPGLDHAQQVAASCTAEGIEARIVELSGLPDKGDVSDWLNAGGTSDRLEVLANEASAWTPDSAPAPTTKTETHKARNAAVPFGVDPCTDVANAYRFREQFGKDALYVPELGWLAWDGRRWSQDEAAVRRMAQGISTYVFAEALEEQDREEAKRLFGWARTSAQTGHVTNCLVEARAILTANVDAFDVAQHVLNVGNGTLHLSKNGAMLRDHRRDDRLTMLAETPFEVNAQAPRWASFLEEIMPDQDVRVFLQRAVGMTLLGGNPEQILLLLHGTGANGKSVFLEVLAATLGDYAATADASTFLSSKYDKGPRNDLAALRGKRLVEAIEIGEGRRFDEQLVKSVTGGDRIRCRFLYRESFE